MTGGEFKRLRQLIGDNTNRRLSTADMAKLCGLAPANGADTIRRWEEGGGPSGPVAALASVFAYACLEVPLSEDMLEAGAGMLHPEILNSEETLISDAPAQIAEAVFRVMILTEVRRRLI